MSCIIFQTILLAAVLGVNGFIPQRCHLDSPSQCSCHFPERPLVSCHGGLTGFPPLGNAHIHTLDLSHNQIGQLSSDTCNRCQGIKRLDLSHNQISKLDGDAFRMSQWRNELQYLDLSYNRINERNLGGLKNVKSLRTLKLDHNDISKISHGDIPVLSFLTTLTLQGNRLTGIDINRMSMPLRSIHLSVFENRHGISLPYGIETFVASESRGLMGGTISKLVPSSLEGSVNLSTLDFQSLALENSELTTSEVLGTGLVNLVPKLKYLSLKKNKISSKEMQEFSTLMTKVKTTEYLDLSHNQLTEIKADTFQKLSLLKMLNLSSNNIKTIDWTFLQYLPNLQILDMSSNNITSSVGIKEPLLMLTKLNSLQFGDNPFDCNCTAMKEIYNIMQISLLEGPVLLDYAQIMHSVTCRAPQAVSGQTVFSFYSQNCQG